MASSPSRIIFVNRFFHPDHSATSEMLSDLAFALSDRGYRVAVITSRLRYDDTANLLSPKESIRGVDVLRVWTSRRGRQRLLGRLIDYVSFYVTAAIELGRIARRGDVIVAKTDPPLISVVAAIVAKLRGAKLVTWQQDIFPEVAEALDLGGPLARLGFALLRIPRNWSLRRAACNVVVGALMAKTLRHTGVPLGRIRVFPNWADGTVITPIAASSNPLRREWGLENHFVVGYAGNLGRVHEIETVLGAIKALSRSNNESTEAMKPIRFLFVGGGALRTRLEAEAQRLNLTNVEFRPYQPKDQLSAALSVPDVHLVILNPKLERLVVPSKVYAVAATGRPAIVIGDRAGELAQQVTSKGVGFAVGYGESSALEQRILQLARSPHLCRIMGKRARTIFEQTWDMPIAIERWRRLFAELIQDGAHSELADLTEVNLVSQRDGGKQL